MTWKRLAVVACFVLPLILLALIQAFVFTGRDFLPDVNHQIGDMPGGRWFALSLTSAPFGLFGGFLISIGWWRR